MAPIDGLSFESEAMSVGSSLASPCTTSLVWEGLRLPKATPGASKEAGSPTHHPTKKKERAVRLPLKGVLTLADSGDHIILDLASLLGVPIGRFP